MKRWLFALAVTLACGGASAQMAVQGQPAPQAVLDQIKGAPVTSIGTQSVRVLPATQQNRQQSNGSGSASDQTLVVRESDNLVGVSNNELVIVNPDLDAVAAKVASLQLPGAQVNAYPKLQLLVVKTTRFEQLETVRNQVAAAFPNAKFDLPVTYFPHKPR